MAVKRLVLGVMFYLKKHHTTGMTRNLQVQKEIAPAVGHEPLNCCKKWGLEFVDVILTSRSAAVGWEGFEICDEFFVVGMGCLS